MRKIIASLLLLSFVAAPAVAQTGPAPVIFDTDMGPDYDDVGAIAVLHAFADSGKIIILGTVASTRYEGVAGVLNVLNTYFDRPGLPIGIPGPDAVDQRDTQHWTDSLLARYPHLLKKNDQAESAVGLYRRLLARAGDSSVIIITVGFLTNIAALLGSGSDEISPLNGSDLVRKKVKRMVSMAGKFPAGREFNIFRDAPSAITAFDRFPRPVIFCGFEIGERIKCGLPLLHDDRIQHSPVKDVFAISIPLAGEDSAGRKSWDEATTLAAVTDPAQDYGLVRGKIRIAADGSNTWTDGGGDQYYLKWLVPPLQLQTRIDSLMKHTPKSRKQ